MITDQKARKFGLDGGGLELAAREVPPRVDLGSQAIPPFVTRPGPCGRATGRSLQLAVNVYLDVAPQRLGDRAGHRGGVDDAVELVLVDAWHHGGHRQRHLAYPGVAAGQLVKLAVRVDPHMLRRMISGY